VPAACCLAPPRTEALLRASETVDGCSRTTGGGALRYREPMEGRVVPEKISSHRMLGLSRESKRLGAHRLSLAGEAE
jgi:hypothetical protein